MRWRLLGAFGLIILIALTTVALVTRYTTQREVRSFIGHGGQVGLENLANALEDYYAQNGTWEGVSSQYRGQGRGQGLGGSNPAFSGHVLADASGVIVLGPHEDDRGKILSETERENSIVLEVKGNPVGYLLPEGGVPELPENFESLLIDRVNRASLYAALISGAIAVVLALILAGVILKPVRELTQAVSSLAEGDLSHRVSISGRHEIARLGKTFNQMASSLQAAEDRRKVMTADIAHELRNPLAIQRAHLEALEDGVYPLTKENLGPLVEQNKQLSRLVEDLRTLALADAGELVLNKRRVDLTHICQELMPRYKPQAFEKGIHLTSHCPSESVFAVVDKERLRQIQDNLMQNAFRFTPRDGWIRLSLTHNEHQAVFEVHNSGSELSDEVLDNLFTRFYRGDKARDREGGGTGLGLAIGRKLAEAHGGSLTGKNHPSGGVVFRLTLPLSGDSADT